MQENTGMILEATETVEDILEDIETKLPKKMWICFYEHFSQHHDYDYKGILKALQYSISKYPSSELCENIYKFYLSKYLSNNTSSTTSINYEPEGVNITVNVNVNPVNIHLSHTSQRKYNDFHSEPKRPSRYSTMDDVTSSKRYVSSRRKSNDVSYKQETASLNSNMNDLKESNINRNIFLGVFWGCILGIFAIVMYSYSDFGEPTNVVNSKVTETEISNIFVDLEQNFPSQKNSLWDTIEAGLRKTLMEKPTQPSIHLILYEDFKTCKCFIHTLGEKIIYLIKSPNYIAIQSGKLNENRDYINDYGVFVSKYQGELKEKKVLVIHDLQEIPVQIVQAFHSICDVYTPLVRDAIIFFTLKVDRNEREEPTAIAERKLNLLWNASLDTEILDPLIVRITDSVLYLEKEIVTTC